MLKLQFFTREGCTLCDSALALVRRVQRTTPFDLEIVDIDGDPAARERFQTVIPVVSCGDVVLAESFVDEKSLRLAVQELAQNKLQKVFSREVDSNHL